MKVSPKTVFYAIHDVLVSLDAKVGDTVRMDPVRRKWTETRLRETDLDKGLKALHAGGFIKLERTMFGDEVQLVNDRFGQVVTEEDQRARAALAVLRKLRAPLKTSAPGARPPRGRRPGDKPS